jgi:hypothetical protein
MRSRQVVEEIKGGGGQIHLSDVEMKEGLQF